jgi:hypothetical protein
MRWSGVFEGSQGQCTRQYGDESIREGVKIGAKAVQWHLVPLRLGLSTGEQRCQSLSATDSSAFPLHVLKTARPFTFILDITRLLEVGEYLEHEVKPKAKGEGNLRLCESSN